MTLYLGWDVGGWHCDHGASRDALMVLDEDGGTGIKGSPWRGNLRTPLTTLSGPHLIEAMLALCAVTGAAGDIVIGIDTPLAWPRAFRDLLEGHETADIPGDGRGNPYTYRRCETWLADRGKTPLSPVKDMIGSQSAKGIHFLRRLQAAEVSVGVWRAGWEGGTVTAFEAYPSVARRSPSFRRRHAVLAERLKTHPDEDRRDALYCALIAHAFDRAPHDLTAPPPDFPADEGWIFVPRDGLGNDGTA